MSADLDALARDRPLVTRELFAPNAYYGHANVLKRFAGLDETRSLKVAIEHGPWLDDEIWDVDAESPMPIYLCAAPWRAEYFERETGKRAVGVGPLIYYALGREPEQPRGRHLLVFPAHSSHHVDALYDVRAFVAFLDGLRDDYETVTICVYWKDVLRGTARMFAEAGYRCVTAGHLFDPGFLPRLARIIEGSTAVLSNEIGTHLLYSVLFGRPFWLVRQEVVFTQSADSDLDEVPLQDFEHPKIARLRETFAERTDFLADSQRDFVRDLVGHGALMQSGELRELLEEAERRWRDVSPLQRAATRAKAMARWSLGSARSLRGA